MIEIRHPESNQENRKRLYTFAILITVAGNVFLAVGKAIAAGITGSAALYSDAANSISDVLYSLMVAVGLFIAAQPPDRSHPQGHSRFEPLVGLVVTAAMTIAAYEAGRNAVETFIEGAKAIPISLPSLVVLASAAVKVVMYLFIKNIARQQDSPSLRAIAVDNLTDILTSIVVFLGTIASTFLAPIFDPIAGIVVGLWIITAAIRSGRENLVFLTGGSANAEIRDQIIKTAASVKGIKNIHHLITEYVGPHLIVDMHCAIDPALPFTRAHEICDEITQLIESMPEVDRAYVHMEPVESGGTERS